MSAKVPDTHPSGESHWQHVHLPFKIGTGRTLYSEDPNDPRLQIRFFHSQKTKALEGYVWFGEKTQGPPDHVHGGVLCYVLDEAMGANAWAERHPVVAGKLSFTFKHMVADRQTGIIKSEIVKTDDARVYLKASLYQGQQLCCEAEAVFVKLRKDQVDALLKNHPDMQLPPGLLWRKTD